MLRMTGDPRVADELELSTLNQIMATFDRSGRWSTYNTPMDGRRVPSTVDIAFQIRPGSEELNCCSVNAARGFGMITDWAVMRDEDGLVLNWYGPSRITAEAAGVNVTLNQKTDYPADGRIELEVDPTEEKEFTLKLRIPHWTQRPIVAVNGKPTPAQPGTYLELALSWKSGDTVSIEFDMAIRFWAGEQQCAGLASAYRGPLLLAYEQTSLSKLAFSSKWNAHADLRLASEAGEFVTYEFEGDQIEWQGARLEDAGKSRVLIDDKEVDVVDQFGTARGEAFLWRKSGLGPGPHKLRIEVLDQKSDESKGTWVNYFRFKTPADLPQLEARQIADAQPAASADNAMLMMDVVDKAGKAVRLRDFGSAGHNGALYASWLPIEGAPSAKFSVTNPSRTALLAD